MKAPVCVRACVCAQQKLKRSEEAGNKTQNLNVVTLQSLRFTIMQEM